MPPGGWGSDGSSCPWLSLLLHPCNRMSEQQWSLWAVVVHLLTYIWLFCVLVMGGERSKVQFLRTPSCSISTAKAKCSTVELCSTAFQGATSTRNVRLPQRLLGCHNGLCRNLPFPVGWTLGEEAECGCFTLLFNLPHADRAWRNVKESHCALLPVCFCGIETPGCHFACSSALELELALL